MHHSKKTHEGYLLIDHRASPGTTQVPENTIYESATVTCQHCTAVIVIKPDRSNVLHYCPKCDSFICDSCRVLGECMPFMEVLDAAGVSEEKLKQVLEKRLQIALERGR